LPRRYVHIGNVNERYPINLSANGCYEFLHKFQRPFNNCKIIIGCNTNCSFSVSINHLGQILLHDEEKLKGFEYIPEAEIGKKSAFIYAVSQAAPYVKSAVMPISENEKELLEITIQNTSAKTVNILWIEFYFE